MSNEPLPAPSPRRLRPLDWATMGRYLAGELPTAEREAVRRQLSEQPADDALVRLVDNAIQRRASVPMDNINVEAALQRVRARRGEPTPRSFLRRHEEPAPRRGPIVAVTLLLLAAAGTAGVMLWQRARTERPAAPVNEAVAPVPVQSHLTSTGQRDSVSLPDGTVAVLGPVSELRLPPAFGSEDRQVEVSGEAYFDVAPGTRPFVVTAGNAAIQVLSTAFAVRVGDSVRVAVSSGSVLLRNTAAAGDTGVSLASGDVGVVAGAAPAAARPGTGTADDLAWMTGRVVFRDAPIAEVAREIRRWYGLALRLPDSATASRPFYGEFETQVESAEVVVRRLAGALGLEVQFRADTAVLTPRTGAPPG